MERTPTTERVAREALEWHALQRQGGLAAVEQARFMDWLVASPEHLRSYLAVGRLAADLAEAMRAMPLDPPGADTAADRGPCTMSGCVPTPRTDRCALPSPPPRWRSS